MKVKHGGHLVDVFEKSCPKKSCFWMRQNPGVFVQGRGYSNPGKDWLCGTRQAHGCPDPEPTKDEL